MPLFSLTTHYSPAALTIIRCFAPCILAASVSKWPPEIMGIFLTQARRDKLPQFPCGTVKVYTSWRAAIKWWKAGRIPLGFGMAAFPMSPQPCHVKGMERHTNRHPARAVIDDRADGWQHLTGTPALGHVKEMHINIPDFTGKYLMKPGGIHYLTFEALLPPSTLHHLSSELPKCCSKRGVCLLWTEL